MRQHFILISSQTDKVVKGEKYFKITYPKFHPGEEVVRDVASPTTYGRNMLIIILILLIILNILLLLFFKFILGDTKFDLYLI